MLTQEECDFLHSRMKGTLIEALGMRFLPTDDEYAVAEMPICPATRQYLGILHGGASLSLAETIHNDAVMPEDIKSRVFIYGNTTKGSGRGLGTYSMKLIGENYLKGHVWFKSEEGYGTEFFFEIDKAH